MNPARVLFVVALAAGVLGLLAPADAQAEVNGGPVLHAIQSPIVDHLEYRRVRDMVRKSVDGGGIDQVKWRDARKAFMVEIRDDFAVAYSLPKNSHFPQMEFVLMFTTLRERGGIWEVLHCDGCNGAPPTKQQLMQWGASSKTAAKLMWIMQDKSPAELPSARTTSSEVAFTIQAPNGWIVHHDDVRYKSFMQAGRGSSGQAVTFKIFTGHEATVFTADFDNNFRKQDPLKVRDVTLCRGLLGKLVWSALGDVASGDEAIDETVFVPYKGQVFMADYLRDKNEVPLESARRSILSICPAA